jgi:hypothetical protein
MLRILNETLLSGGDMTTTLHSAPLELAYSFGYAIQVTYTGSPVGTLILECSNDTPLPADANFAFSSFVPTNWTTVANSTIAISGPDAIMYNFQGAYYRYVRATYTPSSGSGALTVVGNAKGF